MDSSAVEPLLKIENLDLQYKTRQHFVTATHQISFNVHAGDRFVILGPSGCGKSSLLKAIGGYLRPARGQIWLKGRPVKAPSPERMMVFQEFDQLLPWKTVRENVLFPLLCTERFTTQECEDKASAYIHKVNLTSFADSYPHTLSGGMKQRVAIARGMAMEPDVLLMDEPFAALDALTRRKMQEELTQLWSDTRFTLIFVTHSIEEAIVLGNRILLLSPHPGRVRAELNSVDRSDPIAFKALETKIHGLLFPEPGDSK